MLIINDKISALVARVDGAEVITPELDATLEDLVAELKVRCALPEVVERYQQYHAATGVMQAVRLDADGYAPSFDVLTQEAEFVDFWHRYGIVVSKNVVPAKLRQNAIDRIYALTAAISGGACDLSRPETWSAMPVDSNGTPLLSRGFFEIYHDDVLAQLRQSVRVYLHYVLIWGRADLWTTFDRLGVKLPGHGDAKGLPLHVDQNPNVHPHFRTVQGVLALSDCPAERGTYVGVPGSKLLFPNYARMARNEGEYVELSLDDDVASTLTACAQALPLRPGDMVSWDSRTTHANSANVSGECRIVAYIACGVAREGDQAAIAAREEAFRTGLGSNVRDAYMHASMRPRHTDPEAIAACRQSERLTLLGRLIYGKQSYGDIAASTAS